MTEKDLAVTILRSLNIIEGSDDMLEVAKSWTVWENTGERLFRVRKNINTIPLSEVMESINRITVDL